MRPSRSAGVKQNEFEQEHDQEHPLSPARETQLDELQNALQVDWKNPSLLHQALTHSSSSQQYPELGGDNERLEFLGDAVLELAVVQYLYHRFPDFNEGQLSRIRSRLVSKENLARHAREINLSAYLIVGKDQDHITEQDAILADACEAVIGSLYLDKGFEHARRFVLRLLLGGNRLLHEAQEFKSLLQEYSQSVYHRLPRYSVIQETGPDHRKLFRIRVKVGGKTLAEGTGTSKKRAEKAAAEAAWKKVSQLSD